MKKYKIGIVKRRTVKVNGENENHAFASCSCGTIKSLGKQRYYHKVHDVVCDKCGNREFVDLGSKDRVIYPYIEVLKKDRKGFKVLRTNLSVFYDDNFNVVIKENMRQVLIYDLINKEFKIYKNGQPVNLTQHYSTLEGNLSRFFTNIDDSKFRLLVSTEETASLYSFAWERLSNKKTYGERKFWKGLINLLDYTYMQILSNAGFPNVERFYERRGYYYNAGTINIEGKNPKEILGVPKFLLKYIRENDNINIYDIKQIRKALEKVDGNRFKEIMEIVKDESTIKELCRTVDTLVEIHDTYNYNNLKKLTLYIFRETRINQGISDPSHSASLLRDYIRMSTKLGFEFEKYPKSLKKEHDIAQMNYKVQEDAIKKKDFEEVISNESYKILEYKKKDYAIITPKEMDDLIKEGNELSHCVASYVNDIISNRCKIYFLRKTDSISSPLATVEIRGNNVRQARGYANRQLRQEERDFVLDWATKKELQVNYY